MKILLVAYYYPPINSGGTVRPEKMARYLPHFGHRVTVLTHSYEKTDFSHPHTIRIKDISHNKNRRGIKKVQWFWLRLFSETLNRLGIYHSIYTWWKKKVIKNGPRIIESVKPDVILATYPPVETLEIGLEFSRQYGIPLISDFRDGLLFEPIETKRLSKYPCIGKRYGEIEEDAARKSAAVTTVAQPITDYFARQYGLTNAHSISNSFDPEDFTGLPVGQEFDPSFFHIVFTGRFSLSDKSSRVEFFFEALRKLVKQDSNLEKKLKFHLLGEYRKEEIARFKDLLAENIVILHGFVAREHSLAFQKAADLLLIITGTKRSSVATAKIFEYLCAGKPILALTHKTVLADIVRETQTGWVVHPHKPEEIGLLLHKIVTDTGFYNSLRPQRQKIEQFSVKNQVEKLNQLLTNLS